MHTLKLLIVDDEEADRKNFIRMLEQTSMQVEVTEAVNSYDAYDKMQEVEFDCVIMDYWMPGEDGIEGLVRMSEKFPFTPVIMLTVESGLPTVVKALSKGAVDYISKDQANRDSIQRAIENAVEKSEIRKAAESSRQDLVRFSDMMVHDMTAPIGYLANFVDLLLRDMKKGKLERIPEYTEHIQDSTNKLIEFLSTLTKYTKTSQSIELSPVNLQAELAYVLEIYEAAIQEKGVKVEIGDLHEVLGDSALIRQLLQNLIANALKFMDKSEPTIKIESACDNDVVTLQVSDNGIGMPQSALQKIFHPFSRLHSKKDYPGTGLGLATCARIVERHGGRIWCESEEGKGTTFFTEFQAATVNK